jgi:hypothetical protein
MNSLTIFIAVALFVAGLVALVSVAERHRIRRGRRKFTRLLVGTHEQTSGPPGHGVQLDGFGLPPCRRIQDEE